MYRVWCCWFGLFVVARYIYPQSNENVVCGAERGSRVRFHTLDWRWRPQRRQFIRSITCYRVLGSRATDAVCGTINLTPVGPAQCDFR